FAGRAHCRSGLNEMWSVCLHGALVNWQEPRLGLRVKGLMALSSSEHPPHQRGSLIGPIAAMVELVTDDRAPGTRRRPRRAHSALCGRSGAVAGCREQDFKVKPSNHRVLIRFANI